MTAKPYLARRQARLSLDALKRDIVFGFVVSCILLAVGLWNYFLVVGATDDLWRVVAGLGAFGIVLTLVYPSAWAPPQSALAALVRTIGSVLFAVLLSMIYALLVTPLGCLLRMIKGDRPIYQWVDYPPSAMEGWHTKEVLCETNQGASGRPNLVRRFIHVIEYFASRGQYLFLPTLVILLSLGLVLFFVKTSALAPLIYTLF